MYRTKITTSGNFEISMLPISPDYKITEIQQLTNINRTRGEKGS